MNITNKVKEIISKGYLSKPQFLQIEITDYCPLKCSQCYKEDTNFRYMSIDKFEKIVLEGKKNGVVSIMINGGEPLKHDNFIEMVRICNENDIECTTFSSGYLLNDKMCDELEKVNLNMLISLNGSTEEINSLSRDGYSIGINAMKCLARRNIKFGINWVARHDNVKDLPKLIKLGKELGSSYVNVVCNKMMSYGDVSSPLTKDDYVVLKSIFEDNENYLKIQSCYGLLLSYMGMPNNRLYGCQAGIRLMAVNADGKYTPCTHLHYVESADDIKSYWENSVVLKKLREINNLQYCKECGKCRVCHSITKEAHDNLNIGYKNCPLSEKEIV